MPKKALLVLADGFEEIEAFTPFDILKRAGIDVVVTGLAAKEIKSARGAKILADKILDEKDSSFDGIILPGGLSGVENLSKSEKVKRIIKKMNDDGKIIAAICASTALVLEPTGILKGKKATGYPGTFKRAAEGAVVADGNIVTSQGPGTAHLFGFKLAEILAGKEKTESVKKSMLF